MHRSTGNLGLVQHPINNVLHKAILANETEKALQLIREDIEAVLINAQSLQNTPLLLALKRGQIAIAAALLQHAHINVHEKDVRGLTALHWACMLRLNNIIHLLLKRDADPHFETKAWVSGYGKMRMTPFNLYIREVNMSCLQGFAWSDSSDYVDRASLCFMGEMAYTDIIFHIDAICTNLNWLKSGMKFVALQERLANGRIFFRSCDVFKYNFSIAYEVFCEFRNRSAVDEALLQRMQPPILPKQSIFKASCGTLLPGMDLQHDEKVNRTP